MSNHFTALAIAASLVTAPVLGAQVTISASTPEQKVTEALNSQTTVPLIIPQGTPLKVVLDRDVSSASVNVGDTVSFRMAADYSEYNHVLISEGTRVHGVVSAVDRRSSGGDPGNVTLKVQSVRAVDGQHIPLQGTKTAEGKNRKSQAAVLGVLTLGLGGTKKGLSAVMAAGTPVTVYTATRATIVVPR